MALTILTCMLNADCDAQQTPHPHPGLTEARTCDVMAESPIFSNASHLDANCCSVSSGGGRGTRPVVHRSRTSQWRRTSRCSSFLPLLKRVFKNFMYHVHVISVTESKTCLEGNFISLHSVWAWTHLSVTYRNSVMMHSGLNLQKTPVGFRESSPLWPPGASALFQLHCWLKMKGGSGPNRK